MGDLAPGETVDQYQVLDVIARSGMATIFRARDLENGHTVALKVPHLQYASDMVFHERFKREEEIGQRLDHPAVIKVFQPREKSRLYLAMEYVDGELLRDRLRRERRLPSETAVALAIAIADALAYLHDHGVVHRDLKPENIMVTADRRVKLVDFGIALDTTLRKMTWAGLSQTVGTPDYMAPEQVKGKRGDARSDLYALGVILYEMLTGETPFQGDNVYAAMRAKLQDDPTPPRRLRPDISPALEEIILHALERDPRDRPESALELREALAHPDSVVLTGRASRQRPKPRMPRWVRTLLAIAAAGAGYGLLFWALSHAG
ncbi:MAG: serine/threonine protein kinase [Deltaproteobacteria bacterium]|nr:MAG: serine/threonine protein kinase [Deltaproteobacteria bacterium]